jgi:lipoprotein-anchoring transpeptidase ErfK/SrfK
LTVANKLKISLLLALMAMLTSVVGQAAPAMAAPASAPTEASGVRWIDVNLSRQTATAYIGNTPVYTARVTTGKNGRTPTGTFRIRYRVFNETMDSSTIGIPRNSAGGWYLRNVYFTQYFTNQGHALHYNYWAPRSVFGNRPTSAGCVGMEYGDARYFWNFARNGTTVSIHY